MPIGKEGVHCVLPLPLLVCSSSSGLTTVGAFLAGSGIASLSSVPLLNVTTTLASSILALGSLVEPISCIPPWVLLCLGREFPFFRTLVLVRQPGN